MKFIPKTHIKRPSPQRYISYVANGTYIFHIVHLGGFDRFQTNSIRLYSIEIRINHDANCARDERW